MNESPTESFGLVQTPRLNQREVRKPTRKSARVTCIFFASVHVSVTAISTYVATFEIESIIYTGPICSLSGIAVGVMALFCKKSLGKSRFWLALVGFATLALAVGLYYAVQEYSLSPQQAALPFAIILLLHQAICVPVILLSVNRLIFLPKNKTRLRFSIKSLFGLMFITAVFFAIARFLLEYGHTWLMSIGLAFLGLATMGLTITVFSGLSRRANNILSSRKLMVLATFASSSFVLENL